MQFAFVRCALVHYIIFSAHLIPEATDAKAILLIVVVHVHVAIVVIQVAVPGVV